MDIVYQDQGLVIQQPGKVGLQAAPAGGLEERNINIHFLVKRREFPFFIYEPIILPGSFLVMDRK